MTAAAIRVVLVDDHEMLLCAHAPCTWPAPTARTSWTPTPRCPASTASAWSADAHGTRRRHACRPGQEQPRDHRRAPPRRGDREEPHLPAAPEARRAGSGHAGAAPGQIRKIDLQPVGCTSAVVEVHVYACVDRLLPHPSQVISAWAAEEKEVNPCRHIARSRDVSRLSARPSRTRTAATPAVGTPTCRRSGSTCPPRAVRSP